MGTWTKEKVGKAQFGTVWENLASFIFSDHSCSENQSLPHPYPRAVSSKLICETCLID